MVEHLVKAFNEGAVALIEAGTGTGKSIAYLIPSILTALLFGERIVISTQTISLQEQILKKDIPLLKKVLGVDLKVVLVKGMGNYPCQRKICDLQMESAYFPDADLADGAAEAETHGFLDVNNQPPWDTWIAWAVASSIKDESYRGFLIAWIPDDILAFIEVATYVNPEKCIQWVDLLPHPYQYALAALRPDSAEPAV